MDRSTKRGDGRDQEQIVSELKAIDALLENMAQVTTDQEIRKRLENAQRHLELGIKDLVQGD